MKEVKKVVLIFIVTALLVAVAIVVRYKIATSDLPFWVKFMWLK